MAHPLTVEGVPDPASHPWTLCLQSKTVKPLGVHVVSLLPRPHPGRSHVPCLFNLPFQPLSGQMPLFRALLDLSATLQYRVPTF